MLVAQGGFFVWLSTQREEALPPRLVADLAGLVAEDLGEAAARTPGADLAALARERFDDLARPAALVLRDGRLVASDIEPPAPLVADLRRQLAAGDDAWRGRPGRGRWREARPASRSAGLADGAPARDCPGPGPAGRPGRRRRCGSTAPSSPR